MVVRTDGGMERADFEKSRHRIAGVLILVGLIVLTMVFLRSVHGEDGFVATAVSGLVIALLVPYTLLLPAVQLLWLRQQPSERRP